MERMLLDTFKSLSFSPKVIVSDKKHLELEFQVRAKPASKWDKLEPGPSGEMVVHIKAKPVGGAANEAIIKFLSKQFGIPQSNFELKSGEKSKFKRLILTFIFSDTKDESFFSEKFLSSYGKVK